MLPAPTRFIRASAWQGEKPTTPPATASIGGKLVQGWWVAPPQDWANGFRAGMTSPTPTMPAEARPEDLSDFTDVLSNLFAGPAPGVEVNIETGQAPGENKVGGEGRTTQSAGNAVCGSRPLTVQLSIADADRDEMCDKLMEAPLPANMLYDLPGMQQLCGEHAHNFADLFAAGKQPAGPNRVLRVGTGCTGSGMDKACFHCIEKVMQQKKP